MKTKDECIAVLKQFKEEFASKYGIRSIGIFGSVARGENHPDSDVDVFVDLEEADPFICSISVRLYSRCLDAKLI